MTAHTLHRQHIEVSGLEQLLKLFSEIYVPLESVLHR
jgi:hypothetical protein